MNHRLNETRPAAQVTAGLVRIFAQVVALPFTAFIYGTEAIVKAFQGMQGIAGQSRTLFGGESVSSSSEPAAADGSSAGSTIIQNSTAEKELKPMPDQDLSGADTLKLVRYKIVFVKRDYEVVFPEREDVVSYDTTGPAWAALKISEFMGSLGSIRRPDKWRQYQGDCDTGCNTVYPPCAPDNQEYIRSNRPDDPGIPPCDRKYIQIFFEVLQRWQREPADYDKQQVEVLRGIRSEIGGLRRTIG
jgi:hypothetical protein